MSAVGSPSEGWVLRCDAGEIPGATRARGCVGELRDPGRWRELIQATGEMDVALDELWTAARQRGWKRTRAAASGEGHLCRACADRNVF